MAAITSVNAVQAVLKLLASRGLPAVQGAMVMGNLINRDYEATLAQAGDTVNVPIPGVMSRNNIAEGGSVTPQVSTLGNAQVVLNMHSEATFTIPDVTRALTGAADGNFDLIDKFMQPAVIAMAEGIETDILGLYTNLTVNTDVGTSAVAITEDTVDDAETTLFTAKVPESQRKNLIVSAQAYSDLRQVPRFTEQATIGNGATIANGKVGTIKGFDVYRSQFVAKPSSTTYNMAFSKDALALVIRRMPTIANGLGVVTEYVENGSFGFRILASYNPNTLSMQFTIDTLYGVAVLRGSFGVRVLS